MHRDNRCMYMAHACFYICCSDCVGVCRNVCYVAAIIEYIVFSHGVLKYVYVCVRNVMNVVFSVCNMRRGAIDARLWEV